MDPLTAAMITGGAGLIGTHMQNQGNQAQSAEQMRFQERMSGTAHQREVQDLRAAGLNPMLSALGSGASSPQGAAAQMGNFGEGISKGMDTAIAVRAQNKQLDLQDMNISKIKDETRAISANTVNTNQDTKIKNQHVAQEAVKTKVLQATANAAIKKAVAEGDYAQVNQLMGVISSGASSASDIKDIINPISGIIKTKKGK